MFSQRVPPFIRGRLELHQLYLSYLQFETKYNSTGVSNNSTEFTKSVQTFKSIDAQTLAMLAHSAASSLSIKRWVSVDSP